MLRKTPYCTAAKKAYIKKERERERERENADVAMIALGKSRGQVGQYAEGCGGNTADGLS